MTLTHHKDYPGFNFRIHIYDSQRLYQVFCPRLGHCLLLLSFFWLKWGVFPRSFRYRTRMCIWVLNTSINVNFSQIVKIYYNLDRVNIISDPFLDLKNSWYLLTAQGQVVAVYGVNRASAIGHPVVFDPQITVVKLAIYSKYPKFFLCLAII